LRRMPNSKTANGSSRLAIQRPVRTAGELLLHMLLLITSGCRLAIWSRRLLAAVVVVPFTLLQYVLGD
jgi:hypothetical protein